MCLILFNTSNSCEVGITPILQTAIQWQDHDSKSDLCPSMAHTHSTPLWYLQNQMLFLSLLGTSYLVRFQYIKACFFQFLNLQKSHVRSFCSFLEVFVVYEKNMNFFHSNSLLSTFFTFKCMHQQTQTVYQINLDSILKSRDTTLPSKVHMVKATVFPVVMYGCDSWTIKKVECQSIHALELWCWRRLLRVP